VTYCVGILVEDGIFVAADSRSNAGVDQVASVRKLTVFQQPGERVLMLLSSGNLAATQAVINLIEERLESGDAETSVFKAPSMFRVARAVGRAIRETDEEDAEHLKRHAAEFALGFILAGQIAGERPRLFNLYAAGNFIEAAADTPYFQIGELKYGKPILDRLLHPDLGLDEAAKLALLSFDSTLRSNLSVGVPIDMLCYRRDTLGVPEPVRLGEDDAYFAALRRDWHAGLAQVFNALPAPQGC
jgi:putative proteasome-type protease